MKYSRKNTNVQIHQRSDRAKNRIWFYILFSFLSLGLALIWPGVLFLVIGDNEINLESLRLAAILIAAFFIPVWLLLKIPSLKGRSRGRALLFGVFISFLVALGAGIVSPQIRAMQEGAFAPTFTPYLAKLKNSLLDKKAVQVPQKPRVALKTPVAQKAPVVQKADGYQHTLAIGDAYLKKKQYDLAIAAYERANEIRPIGIKAITNRAEAVRLKSQFDTALNRSNMTIDIDPNDSGGYLSRGQAYMGHGQYDLAIADFNRVIQLDPEDSQAFESRAHAHFKKGQYDRAIADFSKAIQLESSPGR